MKKLLFFLIFTIINTGLLQAQQEAPVVTKALRDSIQERLKLVRRYSTNTRSIDIKLARKHMSRVLFLNDSLQLNDANHLVSAGDLEDLAFNYERNKPALGGKTDQAACLAAAKQCYLYYQQAYELFAADPDRYGKNGTKQQHRLQQVALQYYLLTNGFQVNAGASYKKNDLKTTLQEFLLTLTGSQSRFLYDAYQSDTKRFAEFVTFMADSTQCRALYNCATLSSALGNMDESLAYYDSLKLRGYEPDKVYRNTIAIHTSRHDTVQLVSELQQAIEVLPDDIWYQKNLLQIYLDRQQWQDAELAADHCIRTDSTDASSFAIRGQLYEMRGDISQAMTSYLRSYALDTTQANVCSYIGRIHYNRAATLRAQLYDQRQFKRIDTELQPIYDQALPWYDRAYKYDKSRQDKSIPMAIREILYSRFTKANCPNRQQLIARYDAVSKAYGLAPFGQ